MKQVYKESKMSLENNNESIVPMIIENDYSTFQEFYQTEKYNIYKKISDLFQESIKENIEKKLMVIATVQGTVFDSTFNVGRSNELLITEKVIPYFAELEEYETCLRLSDLCSKKDNQS